MTIKEVLMIGNPKLREKSSDLEDFNLDFVQHLQDLKDTLTYLQETKKFGRAIAAPQIGVMKKLICYQLPKKSFYMVNPKITWKSEEMLNVWDSCYSFDIAFFVEIQRHKTIKVEYQDENGNLVFEDFSDDLSELVQHEIDHLHGILATDRLKDVKKIIMRSEWERRFRKSE
ncbi:MAG: peptide deformylase [Promethearchaeota archaeon]|nr:MAG: peptide deformylase [Candidatus Lokiarchaeota archaeon]